jgi:hypothetical protein
LFSFFSYDNALVIYTSEVFNPAKQRGHGLEFLRDSNMGLKTKTFGLHRKVVVVKRAALESSGWRVTEDLNHIKQGSV